MGLLRLLLAIAVLIAHSGPLFGIQSVGGEVAVEAFFMISGFYMALVLNGRYSKGSYSLFITNRLLRLFPLYWVMVVLTIIVSTATYFALGTPLKWEAYLHSANVGIGTWGLIAFSNLCIIGQDLIMFLGLDQAGHLHFTNDFMRSSPPLYAFMFDHPAWSLAIELAFYFIAPFLVRRKPIVLVALCAASLLIRFAAYQQGLYRDPWSYRFFPSELVFFLVGALAYRAYAALQLRQLPRLAQNLAFWLVVAYTVFYQYVPGGELVRQVGYYVCFALALPLIFARTKDNKQMNKIGELSYPVYISHLLVLLVLPAVLNRLHLSQNLLPYLLVAGTILFSVLLVRYVADPIEVYRQRRVTARKQAQAAQHLVQS